MYEIYKSILKTWIIYSQTAMAAPLQFENRKLI